MAVGISKDILPAGRWCSCLIKEELVNLIYSFIPDISIAPIQVYYCSEALPTRALILCRS